MEDLNPQGTWIQMGSFISAYTKALEKSAEQVCHPRIRDKMRKIQTLLQETAGAKVSKSPQQQQQALHLVMTPDRLHLQWNTQVPGKIQILASLTGTSFHVPYSTSASISIFVASSHLSLSGEFMAASQPNVSGSNVCQAEYDEGWKTL